jgi:carboxynorspermidine decarboxylase
MQIQYPEIASPAYVLEEKLLLKNLSLLDRVQKEARVEIICALKGISFYHV